MYTPCVDNISNMFMYKCNTSKQEPQSNTVGPFQLVTAWLRLNHPDSGNKQCRLKDMYVRLAQCSLNNVHLTKINCVFFF